MFPSGSFLLPPVVFADGFRILPSKVPFPPGLSQSGDLPWFLLCFFFFPLWLEGFPFKFCLVPPCVVVDVYTSLGYQGSRKEGSPPLSSPERDLFFCFSESKQSLSRLRTFLRGYWGA